ncbi:MAG: helix-turn-helix domain-containing protein [Coxiellaceae bacterium]|nr:helix-turn-helix domain-containing protein [Coxiellaceae bacterium]
MNQEIPSVDELTPVEMDEAEQPANRLGAMLRQGREQKSLTIEEVAEQLYLTPSKVMALEEGDYRNIVAKTYVRGYINSYAKMVDLPQTEIDALFAQVTFQQQSRHKPAQMIITKEKGLSINLAKWFALTGSIVIIAVMGIWYNAAHKAKPEKLYPQPLNSQQLLPEFEQMQDHS